MPSSPRKLTWSRYENEKLRTIVERYDKHGKIPWNEVAQHFGGRRTAKRCRERWVEYLDPSLRKEAFTPEEDAAILEGQERLGNRWKLISESLPLGKRSQTSVKCRWKELMRQGKTSASAAATVAPTTSVGTPITPRHVNVSVPEPFPYAVMPFPWTMYLPEQRPIFYSSLQPYVAQMPHGPHYGYGSPPYAPIIAAMPSSGGRY